LSKLAFIKFDITNLAYAIRSQGRAAIIGIGGGRDLLSAYVFGFHDVTGIELNPIFVDWLANKFHSFNRLTDLPGIRIFVDEARSWFARTQEQFDLIQMSLIDTWAATGTGAFTLSENGLYTVQGWRHFLAHLAPNGVFTASRWYDANNVNETGRLVSLAAATLRSKGIIRLQEHIFLAANNYLATLVVSNEPYSAKDIATLERTTEELGFSIIVSPGSSSIPLVLRRILDARTEQEVNDLRGTYHLDLSAPTDARPFFFNQLRLTDPASMLQAMNAVTGVTKGNLVATFTLLVILTLSAALCFVAIIFPALPAIRETQSRLVWLGSTYFILIGLGFMLIEIGIIQRVSIFLGHPVYGLAIGLFGIIVSTGVGSIFFERVSRTEGRIMVWAVLVALYVAVLPLWLPTLVETFEGGPLPTRILVSLMAIAPSGILMGFGFPAGMSLVRTIDERPMPWFWAINGAAGVLAASAAILVSMEWSINASLWLGALCYLLVGPVGLSLDRTAGKTQALGAFDPDSHF
jgi:spermidine synthase